MSKTQEATVTHTPTPWLVDDQTEEVIALGEEPSEWINIRSEDGTLASTYMGGLEVNRANAAHIVRCVNSHAALLELLEDCGNALTDCESELLEAAMVSMSAADRYTDNRALIAKLDSFLKELRS